MAGVRLAVLVLACLAVLPAADQTPVISGLTARLHLPVVVPRAHAPFPLTITLVSSGQALREGSLEVLVADGNEVLCHWQGDALVLGPGERTSTVLLPPLNTGAYADALDLRVAWIAAAGRSELARRSISLRTTRDHLLTLAVCFPLLNQEPERTVLPRLCLERYAPARGRADATTTPDAPEDGETPLPAATEMPVGSGLRTIPARLMVADLPEAALAWCAYDAVVIAGDGLGDLKPRQVQALEQWLRAGGSACLLPERRIAPALSELLTRLATEAGGRPLDPRALRADGGAVSHVRLAIGLGRLVVTPWQTSSDEERAGADIEWRQSAAFLWRVRNDHAGIMVAAPTWDRQHVEKVQRSAGQRRVRASEIDRPFDAPALDLRDALVDLLWPERVEMIPFSAILLIFLVFVLMIGPGDWFLLGWLRARRFTWLLFPGVAIACTWFTVQLAHHYLGANDQFQHLRIVDFAPDGTQLRRNHFELLFSGSSKTVVSSGEDTWWSPLGSGDSRRQKQLSYRRMQNVSGSSVTEAAGVRYRGTLPGRFTVEQDVAQWTPVLRRELAFTSCTLPWTVPLAAIVTPADVAVVATRWREQSGARSVVLVVRSGRVSEVIGDRTVLVGHGDDEATDRAYEGGPAPDDWLTALCTHPTTGWFALGSMTSPAGGATYADLAISDPSAADEFVVIFAAWEAETLWLARCRYHDRGAASRPPSP